MKDSIEEEALRERGLEVTVEQLFRVARPGGMVSLEDLLPSEQRQFWELGRYVLDATSKLRAELADSRKREKRLSHAFSLVHQTLTDNYPHTSSSDVRLALVMIEKALAETERK